MNVIDKIKEELLIYRKAKANKSVGLYSTLLSSIEMIGKDAGNRETTEDEAMKVIKKFIKGSDIILNTQGITYTQKCDAQAEKTMLSKLLVGQLTEPELSRIIDDYVANGIRGMGPVMKKLREEYPNKYNGTLAAEIAKSK